MDFLLNAVVIGIGGTAAMDLWALLLGAVFGAAACPTGASSGAGSPISPKALFSMTTSPRPQAIPNETALAGLPTMPSASFMPGHLICVGRTGLGCEPDISSGLDSGPRHDGRRLVHPAARHGCGLGRFAAPQSHAACGPSTFIAHTVFAFGLFATAWLLAKF